MEKFYLIGFVITLCVLGILVIVLVIKWLSGPSERKNEFEKPLKDDGMFVEKRSDNDSEAVKNKRFICCYKECEGDIFEHSIMIFYDKVTRVMYMRYCDENEKMSMVVMMNADGKPLLYDGELETKENTK